MAKTNRRRLPLKLRVAFLITSALAVLIALVGTIIVAVERAAEDSAPAPTPSASASSNGNAPADTTPEVNPEGESPDASIDANGLLTEPATTDPRAYGAAAVQSLFTMDTAASTREQWVERTRSWMRGWPAIEDQAERDAALEGHRSEVGRLVGPASERWDSMAASKTRTVAALEGDARMDEELLEPFVPEGDGRHLVTADLVVQYTSQDPASGGDLTYDERVSASVMVHCAEDGSSNCTVLWFYSTPRR